MKITIIKEQNEPTRTYSKKKSLLTYVFAISVVGNLSELLKSKLNYYYIKNITSKSQYCESFNSKTS